MTKRGQKNNIPCPHCQQACPAVTLRTISVTAMELGYRCPNEECGHRFVVVAEATHTLSLPAVFNPAVKLALSDGIDRAALLAALANLPTQARTGTTTPA